MVVVNAWMQTTWAIEVVAMDRASVIIEVFMIVMSYLLCGDNRFD